MLVVSPRHLNHQVVVIWPMFRSLAVHVLLLFLNLSSNLSINTTTCSSSTRSREKNYRQDEVLDLSMEVDLRQTIQVDNLDGWIGIGAW